MNAKNFFPSVDFRERVESHDTFSGLTDDPILDHLDPMEQQSESESVVVQLSDISALQSLLNIPDLSEESLLVSLFRKISA